VNKNGHPTAFKITRLEIWSMAVTTNLIILYVEGKWKSEVKVCRINKKRGYAQSPSDARGVGQHRPAWEPRQTAEVAPYVEKAGIWAINIGNLG
jgi:hypothetical protein